MQPPARTRAAVRERRDGVRPWPANVASSRPAATREVTAAIAGCRSTVPRAGPPSGAAAVVVDTSLPFRVDGDPTLRGKRMNVEARTLRFGYKDASLYEARVWSQPVNSAPGSGGLT